MWRRLLERRAPILHAVTTTNRVQEVLADPDPARLDAIHQRTWTGHNIPLTTSDSTLGPDVPLISEDPRTVTIKALIRRDFRASVRILDLGSLEGGLSLEMAREGWETLGIEGRCSNFEKAELIREYFALDNLRFEHRDVKSLDPRLDGVFDVILCCGLLYHLDNPFAFLETLVELLPPNGLLFIDTHVAPDAANAQNGTHAGQLSDPTTLAHGGQTYDGRWFSEPKEGTVLDQQWSAVSNERSFWPSRRSLIRGAYHAGFHAIAELFGMFQIEREFGLRDQFSRLYLACRRQW
jgi:2-polyprenyl-3-methyl-5-hydroxy-6-metoxy-1,4-benzoquinol methylase